MLLGLGAGSNIIEKSEEPIYNKTNETVLNENSSYLVGSLEKGKKDIPRIADGESIRCKNCNKWNFVEYFAPYDIDCIFCGKPVRYKLNTIKCLNCGYSAEDTGRSDQKCPNSNCKKLMKYKVIPCIRSGCNAENIIYDDTYYSRPCCGCGDRFFDIERCINCDAENRIFKHDSYHYKETCTNCGNKWGYSNNYARVDFNLTVSVRDNSVSPFLETTIPLVGCMVELYPYFIGYSEASEQDRAGIGYSDKNGDVRILVKNEKCNYRLRAFIHAGDENVKLYKYINNTKDFASTSYSEFRANRNSINKLRDFNCTDYYEDSEGRIFLIAQAAMRARDYAQDMMGRKPSDVIVNYPSRDTNHNGSFYSPSTNTIHIKRGELNCNYDAVMHEYGHHVQNQENIDISGEDAFGSHEFKKS